MVKLKFRRFSYVELCRKRRAVSACLEMCVNVKTNGYCIMRALSYIDAVLDLSLSILHIYRVFSLKDVIFHKKIRYLNSIIGKFIFSILLH